MPEGHLIHRLANAFSAHFAGPALHASSPQGRFADGAATLDGLRLHRAEAWGKQMFLLFEGDRWLRVHLGMYGMWRFRGPGLDGIGRGGVSEEAAYDEDGRPLPRGAVRLRLASATHLADLSGPSACVLQDEAEKNASTALIGPDPLRPDARSDLAWDTVSASRTAIGQLLMRQDVVGGIGNIYRAELLFRARLDPHKPGRDLARPHWDALWADACDLMADGVRQGTIITTRQHADNEAVASHARHDGRFYVAFRHNQPCRVCGSPVRMEPMAGRKLYWCATCQTE